MSIPLNIDWQQILLHLFNFIILSVGLYLLLYKPIREFMNKRIAHYQEMSDYAQRELEKATMKEQNWNTKLSEIDLEIKKKEDEAQRKSSQEASDLMAQTQVQCDKLLAQARENAEREREKILNEAKKEAGELAIQAVEKLLGLTSENPMDNFLEMVGEGSEKNGA